MRVSWLAWAAAARTADLGGFSKDWGLEWTGLADPSWLGEVDSDPDLAGLECLRWWLSCYCSCQIFYCQMDLRWLI